MKLSVVWMALASAAVLLTSCKPPQKGLDAENELNPYFRKAADATAEGNYYAAIEQYEAALQANKNVAKAHVEMGLLYSEKLGDPVSGIYHFQKYLAVRPTAEDREQIQAYVEKAKIDFALTLPNSTVHNAEEMARLSKENMDLKQALAQRDTLQARKDDSTAAARINPVPAEPPPSPAQPASPTGAPTVEHTAAATAPITAPATETIPSTAGARSYTIQKGDSLWKIAKQFYPDDVPGGVQKIKQANPEATAKVQNLKLGTTLVIP
ncbi:MAG: LysM domain-containing protein [Candidatus Methylacidiphilales bacterium]|nr:LysM domain-containing protein [Candidatus Methylacidiphilales bacterium]